MTDTPKTEHRRIRRFLLFVPLFIAGAFVFGFVLMLLWNVLMPQLFHLSRIGYWQALGLFILGRLLLGGFSPTTRVRVHRPPFGESRPAPPADAYQSWWEAEGKASFEQYLKR